MFDASPDESGSSRAFVVAAGLGVGLLAGFAAGYAAGQRVQMVSSSALVHIAGQRASPPGAAEAPAQTYTETPIAETPAEVHTPEVVQPPTPSFRRASTSPVASGSGRTLTASPHDSRPRVPANRRTGTVVVVSRPSGAQVFLDERLVGTTPLSLGGVAAGTHGVRIALPQHRRWATVVTVTDDSRVRVAASLER